jgi:tetratricopeptide (TPR) repeat protein
VIDSRAEHDFTQALASLDRDDKGGRSPGPLEQVEMLAAMALGLQKKPKTPTELHHAVTLYDRALALCPTSEALIAARLRARKATALRSIPGPGIEHLMHARAELEGALPALALSGASTEEIADAEMSLGVVLQSLAGAHAAKLTDAIAAYQRATRVFNRELYPREFAILQNNLATAYLSMPAVDERAKLREALAVQAFTEALQAVSMVDDPVEYAMLQNNLGNALQYAASGHPLQNNLRALEAYEEALKVRNARDTPVEYANTVANKANCLRNLPDDPARPDAGNRRCLLEAAELYGESVRLFFLHGEREKALLVEQVRGEVLLELREGRGLQPPSGAAFGRPRIHKG